MPIIDISQVTDEIVEILGFGFLGFVIAMLITPIYTTIAYKRKWWKRMRTETITGEKAEVLNRLHQKKHRRHIPTMAGLVMVIAIAIVTLVFNLSREQTYLPLAALAGAAFVGLIDDVINLKGLKRGIQGLRASFKFWLIFLVATLGALYFYFKLGYTDIHIPFLAGGEYSLSLGFMLIPLFILVILSTANSVNMADGLDGLAGGLLVNAFTTYAVIAFLQGNYGISGFCMTIVGVLLAYIWFNIYPARFMMGDVGSFALGTALGVVAMLTNTIILLPIIGFVFVVEAGSAVIQLKYKKLFKKKLFISTPIHHHFEASGWPETKITMRFWVISQVMGVVGLLLAILGGSI